MSGTTVVAAMLNQGYSLDVTPGWLGAIGANMGPDERMEMYRAEMVDAICDERLKRERKNRKDDEEMY